MFAFFLAQIHLLLIVALTKVMKIISPNEIPFQISQAVWARY